jgi:hypothetical protein
MFTAPLSNSMVVGDSSQDARDSWKSAENVLRYRIPRALFA